MTCWLGCLSSQREIASTGKHNSGSTELDESELNSTWSLSDPYTTKPKADKGGTLLVEVINSDPQESRLLVHRGVKNYVWNSGDSLEWLWAFPHSIVKINEKIQPTPLKRQDSWELRTFRKTIWISQLYREPWPACIFHQIHHGHSTSHARGPALVGTLWEVSLPPPHPLPRGLNLRVWWKWGTF